MCWKIYTGTLYRCHHTMILCIIQTRNGTDTRPANFYRVSGFSLGCPAIDSNVSCIRPKKGDPAHQTTQKIFKYKFSSYLPAFFSLLWDGTFSWKWAVHSPPSLSPAPHTPPKPAANKVESFSDIIDSEVWYESWTGGSNLCRDKKGVDRKREIESDIQTEIQWKRDRHT